MDRASHAASPRSVTEQFTRLFQGNHSVHGHDHGYSVPRPPDFHSHLYGLHPTGIYPMVMRGGVWEVRWSCIDIDKEDYPLAREFETLLDESGVQAWVERSRSKGYHVWMFWDQWLSALDAFFFGRLVIEELGYPKMESNPKQATLPEGKLGNYVRLPYPAKHHKTHRQMMMIEGELLSLEEFLEYTVPTPAHIATTHARFHERYPTRIQMPSIGPSFDSGSSQRSGMGEGAWKHQEAAKLLSDPSRRLGEGARDTTFFTMAQLLRQLGTDEDTALKRMLTVLHHQTDGDFPESVIHDKIRRAYAQPLKERKKQ